MRTALRALCVALALAAPCRAQKPTLPEELARHNVLAELWQRRILPPDSEQWSAEDMVLLARIRKAEAAGAVATLHKRSSGKGLVVSYRPPGSTTTRLRLTKEGYEKYLFARSQEALEFFESRGVDAKWVFQLTDMKDRKLFDGNGLLTEEGEELYARALAGLKSFWKTPDGEISGNRPPPKSAKKKEEAPPPEPEETEEAE